MLRCFQVLAWTLGTSRLGVSAVYRLGRFAGTLGTTLSDTQRCPRGHEVSVYGVYECACGALHEGWAFGPCSVCGQAAGWTPCPVCGLAVVNTWRG